MDEFKNRVVLITGAAGNLGQAAAEVFAAKGGHLALVDRNESGLQAVRDALPADTTVNLYPTDLINPESVAASVEKILADMGHIHVLANIAGGFTMGPMLHETRDKDWDFMFNLNTRSVFNTCRVVIPGMLSQGGGCIINVSARAAQEGKAKMAPYCASKAAVTTLTESLAAEHKFNNINVNCILPGTVDTPQNRTDMPDADHSKWVAPAALADVIAFLASDSARAVTGAAIPVYGQS
jgi:NAD(P)-dependent dehydrogenase (short-subunit alcohol dehydrogenase family)